MVITIKKKNIFIFFKKTIDKYNYIVYSITIELHRR